MKRTLVCGVVAVGMAVSTALAAQPGAPDAEAPREGDAIVGVWVSGEGKGRVRIERGDGEYQGAGEYQGTIVWLKQPLYSDGEEDAGTPKRDRNNPDAALRDRPIIGLPVLQGLEYDGDGVWSGGTIYDPENGKTYKCRVKLKDADTLDVRGFIGISLVGRSTEWTRYDSENAENTENRDSLQTEDGDKGSDA
jgi:uncharacterized protein (DUF2147 family)